MALLSMEKRESFEGNLSMAFLYLKVGYEKKETDFAQADSDRTRGNICKQEN